MTMPGASGFDSDLLRGCGQRLVRAVILHASLPRCNPVVPLPLLGVGQARAATVRVVYIHEIQYSPAGPDIPVTTAKLNGEWVQLTNTTAKSVTMTSWKPELGHPSAQVSCRG